MTVDLSRFPRVPLGVWPTPLEEAPRLSDALGTRVLIKRDDVNGLGVGGNKLRKLEFSLGQALADGADTVITFGALQTNHGRQTAAACAKLGLRCELVLTAKVPWDGEAYERGGNIILDHLFGARVHRCETASETSAVYTKLVEEAAAEGRTVATLPVGGSDAVGLLGYVAAGQELRAQLTSLGISSARVLTAHGSGGTAAGLALGWDGQLDVACVGHTAEESRVTLESLVDAGARHLGMAAPSVAEVRISDRTLGPGYGLPTGEMWAALRLFGRTEGVVLDPVYSGKAAALLVAEPRPSEGPVVFLHTGGLPGLFGYGPAASAAFDN